MPRYFFSCEGAQTFRDTVGTELADDTCARVQAVQNSGQVLKDHAAAFARASGWHVFVTDAAGRDVFSFSMIWKDGA